MKTVTFNITFFSITMHVVLHHYIPFIIHQRKLKKKMMKTERKKKE
jgi:hypothetical protein